jgi:DNA topoisomerase-1
VGRYGPYLEVPAAPGAADGRRVTVPPELAPDELTLAKAKELIAAPAEQARVLGTEPSTGFPIEVKNGRFGPYVAEVPPDSAPKGTKGRNASLFKSMDVATVTLDQAVQLLSLPRVVGKTADGAEITAQNGRYGPYIKAGSDSRSLAGEDQIFTVTEEEARAILAQPKARRGSAAAPPLRELGADPATGKPVVVKDGRYGPYVTDGQTNATLHKADDPAQVTLERAAELLAAKRERGPAKRPRSAPRTSAKRSTAKAAGAKTAAKTPKKAG